eukprot:Em0017g609a
MEQLLAIEGVNSQHDTKGLRHLYDVVESNVRSLKSLGVNAESYGSLLSPVLMNKLPSELKLIVSRKFKESDDWDFAELLKLIEEEVQARERTSACAAYGSRQTKELPTGAALLVDTPSPHCCFCQQQHPSQNCQTVTGVESRRESLQRTGRCFVCLGKGHISRNCRSRIKCLSCKGRHHVAVCSSKLGPRAESTANCSNAGSENSSGLNIKAPSFKSPATSSLWTYSEKTVLLQMAQATVFNPDLPSRTLRVRIVMNTGSQRSYITEGERNQLRIDAAGQQNMTIMTFGATQGGEHVCEYVKVGLKLRNGQTQLLTLFSVPIICGPLIPHHLVKYREAYPHLEGLEFADDPGNVQQLHVDILIGSDYYWDLITGRLQRGLDGPVAIQTKLGWVLSGPISTPDQAESSHSIMTHVIHVDCQSLDSTLNDTMKSFWELESFGIPDADRSLYDEYRDTIRFHEGRYEVQLPWKMPRQNLPNNYDLSLKRLKGLLHRLKHDCDILLEYDTTIKTQLQQGIIERVEEPKIVDTSGVHYIPHHAVIRRDKTTTKLRIVYDASSKTDGFSLNDCLNPGPKFDQRILDILCRFRVHRVAVTADIEKAFLLISVAARDRDFLRFLWVDDPTKEEPSLVSYRFTRVVFGVNASPFLLNATLRHHLELHSESHRDLDPKVLRSIYVDDIVTGSGSNEEAYELYAGAKALLKAGAFNLRKFSTNSRSLQATNNSEEAVHLKNLFPIPSDNLEMFSQATLGCGQGLKEGEQKVLGINWHVTTDQIIFTLGELAEQARGLEPTK